MGETGETCETGEEFDLFRRRCFVDDRSTNNSVSPVSPVSQTLFLSV